MWLRTAPATCYWAAGCGGFRFTFLMVAEKVNSLRSAQRSVPRLLLPMFVVGLLATLACLALNYKVAPHAEAVRKILHEQLTNKKKKSREPI